MTQETQKTRAEVGYCAHGPEHVQTTTTGVLAGQRMAVKDLFALAGEKNAAGNPDWYASHDATTATADAIALLLNEGAIFNGFTLTDELAYSLEGNNAHYGKTENPVWPGHACGGSSMGSAGAVASGFADIGIGTDTGGSVRVPASYCGLYGIRPSHGLVSTEGLIGLAPRFDTVGWFCNNAALLERVGNILVPEQPINDVTHVVLDEELIALVEPELQSALEAALHKLESKFTKIETVQLHTNGVYSELADVFRILQGRAIANYHRDWLVETKPTLSAPVQARMDMALAITEAEVREAENIRDSFKGSLSNLLSANSALFLPTTPTVAPELGADTTALRPRLLKLTAIAGLTGSAQVHLPLLPQHVDGVSAPYGFSLLMLHGNDRSLLKAVSQLSSQWSARGTS